MKRVILASGSPRRKMLLKKLGIKFDVIVGDIEEILNPKLKPDQQAEYLSKEKAVHVAGKVANSIIVAADTTVIIGKQVLGKPKDKEEAIDMLQRLSGKMHKVVTGFTVIDQSANKVITRTSEARIWLRKLTKSEIENYINEFHPFDKAGGYGIQDIMDIFVEKMEGDYASVLGLPLNELSKVLNKLGVDKLKG